MKNAIFLFCCVLCSCFSSYPVTTIWIANQTDKTVHFKAGSIKYSSMGPFEMTLPFYVSPNDSVLVRRVQLKPTANPTDILTRVTFFPVENITFSDPQNPSFWKKSTDSLGRPQFTYYIQNQ